MISSRIRRPCRHMSGLGGRGELGDKPLALGQALVPEQVSDFGPSAHVDDPGTDGAEALVLEEVVSLPRHVSQIGVSARAERGGSRERQTAPARAVKDDAAPAASRRNRLSSPAKSGSRAATNRAKAGFLDRNWIARSKAGHVVVFPDRHMLVEVADQRGPPPDHPAAGLAKERQPGLFDEPGIGRPLVGPDPDPPLAVNVASGFPAPAWAAPSVRRHAVAKRRAQAESMTSFEENRDMMTHSKVGSIESVGRGIRALS